MIIQTGGILMTHQLFSAIDKIFHSHPQRGAILVLFAITFPFLMAFSAIAVDLGTVYVQRVHMQNAVDAGALAGAGEIADDSTQSYITSTAQQFVSNNIESGDTAKVSTVNNTDSSTDVTVTLTKNVPLYFFRYFGFDNMPVTVTATARYIPGSNSTFDSIFDNALAGGSNYNKIWTDYSDDRKNASIFFHTTNISIKGNVLTNGKIVMDNYHAATIDGSIIANRNVDPVWGFYGWYNGQQKYYTTSDSNGNDSSVSYNEDATSISEDANPKIKNYINNIVTLAQNNSSYAVGGKNHIYYSDSGAALGLKTLKDSTGNNYIGFTNNNDYTYSTIVTSGDTQVNTGYDSSMTPSDNIVVIVKNGNLQANITSSLGTDNNGNPKNIILIAENGNINLQNSVPVNALIYAPNGLVTIDGNGSEIKGSIVAKNIIMTTGGQKITHTSISSGSSSSTTTKGSVTLIK
jgi:Flp pilus assembly protein TadG